MRELLKKEETALFVIDVQQKLFPHVERSCEMMHSIQKLVKGFKIMHRPIIVTEQYPQGLGQTLEGLKEILGEIPYFSKTTFSCCADSKIQEFILNSSVSTFVLSGIEAHVCVLQTAVELLKLGKKVVVANDAISSRSIYDYSTAIAELRDFGARISSTETILFELVRDAKSKEFKEISKLIQ
jgi:nicotinamidase-related amidase